MSMLGLKAKNQNEGVKHMGIGSSCMAEWKKYIRQGRYREFIEESSMIAMLFYREKDTEWINALQSLNNFLEDMGDRQIMPHVKKYLMDFIESEIKTIKGEMTKKKLMKERQKTMNLISKAHTS